MIAEIREELAKFVEEENIDNFLIEHMSEDKILEHFYSKSLYKDWKNCNEV